MAEAKAAYIRIDIGLEGGQVLVARVDKKSLDLLTKSAKSGNGWVELSAEEGDISVDSSKINYIRVESVGGRVGF